MDPAEIQGLCLVNSNARQRRHFMVHHYDHMPPAHRAALANSRFNICAACYKDAYTGRRHTPPEELVSAIEEKILAMMERGNG